MPEPSLVDLQDCFEGVIPSIIATADAAGLPNVSYLSQVTLVDEQHIALSNQFFSKTVRNIEATGRATLLVVDARLGKQFILDLEFDRSETTGALFERMSTQIQAIGGQMGMGDVMALRSADIYRVASLRMVPVFDDGDQPAQNPAKPARLAAVTRLVNAVGQCEDADTMIDVVLDGLISEFGYQCAMIFVPNTSTETLTTISSRGYDSIGIGSEVTLGEGVIGLAADQQRPVRINDVSRGQRIVDAVRAELHLEQERAVPLPGLEAPQSQLAVPMISQNQFYGVLFAESQTRFAFAAEDEDALGAIAGHLAASLHLAEVEGNKARAEVASPAGPAARPHDAREFELKYYSFDQSVFIDGEYIIKGVPGRLLMYFLTHFLENDQTGFTNREIRRDRSLRLPDVKDNLETRLILLRRRLDEKEAPVRLLRPERGRIQLDVRGAPRLEVISAS